MKKLIATVLLSGILMCVSGCEEEYVTDTNKSDIVETKSEELTVSEAYAKALNNLQYYKIQYKFNSVTNIDIASYTYDDTWCYNYKDERIDCFEFVIKGNASGYVDEYNDDYNKMTFTFTVCVSKQDGSFLESDFDFDWKY